MKEFLRKPYSRVLLTVLFVCVIFTSFELIQTRKGPVPTETYDYTFSAFKDVSFSVKPCFRTYGKGLCATPDSDHVSVIADRVSYSGSFENRAASLTDARLEDYRTNANYMKYEPVAVSVAGYDGIEYKATYGINGLVRIVCLNDSVSNKVIVLQYVQSPYDTIQNDYSAAFDFMLYSALKK